MKKWTMRISYSHPSYGDRSFLGATDHVVIGRQKADLDLTPDLQVSQTHARITVEDGGWWIEDLESRNGTFVNGREIKQRTRLLPSAVITIGETKLKLEVAEEDTGDKGMRFSTVRANEPT